MKLIIKVIILVIVLFGVVSLLKKEADSNEKEPLISFKSDTGSFSLKIREKEKEELKTIVSKVKGLIYKEATLHNPPGDMLPDQIDDTLINKVKETVN